MTGRYVLQVFEDYNKARIAFVMNVADLSSRPHNADFLDQSGAVDLLKPLLSDAIPSVQHTAAVALGRLANHQEKFAIELLDKGILVELLQSLEKQNKCFRKAALFTLRAICKHSTRTATGVMQAGGLQAMITGLQDFDPDIKELAAWGVGYVARHSEALAQSVVDVGAVPLLMGCLRDKRLCLKQIGASALCDIGKHSFLLAQNIADSGIVRVMAKCMDHPDVKFKRQMLATMAHVARQSADLAEHVVETEVLPDVFVNMAHPDDDIQRNAANVVREITKHSLQLSQVVVNAGGIAALLEQINGSSTDSRVPAIMALGFISIHSEYLAMAIIDSKGVEVLSRILQTDGDQQFVLAAVVWSLGQIGRHSPAHAHVLAEAKVFPQMLELYRERKNSNDLRLKCKDALKATLQQCTDVEALEPLLYDVPPVILKYVLRQFSKILPHDLKARRLFVTTGSLKKLQEMHPSPGTKMVDYISIINSCFPEDIVRYYSPGYPDLFLERLDSFRPEVPSLYTLSKEPGGVDDLTELGLHIHDTADIIVKPTLRLQPTEEGSAPEQGAHTAQSHQEGFGWNKT